MTHSDSLAGGVVLYCLRVVERLGGFNESLPPFGPEDRDWLPRALRAGYEVRFAPAARVWYPATGWGSRIHPRKVEHIVQGRLLCVWHKPSPAVRDLGTAFIALHCGLRPLPRVARRGQLRLYGAAVRRGVRSVPGAPRAPASTES